MSIQSQINRLKAAKEAIRQAIVKKGINVPTTTTIDDMQAYIAKIVGGSGGGLPSGIQAIDFGTYTKTSASNTTAFEVTHNLGVVPDFVFFYSPQNISQTYSMLGAMRGTITNWRANYNSFYFYHGNSSSTVTITNNSNATYGVGSFTASSFKVASHSTSYYWRAGTYNYIAIKFA